MLVVATTTINQTLYPGLDFNIATDYQPVTALLRVANVLVVHPSVPAKTPAPIAVTPASEGAGAMVWLFSTR